MYTFCNWINLLNNVIFNRRMHMYIPVFSLYVPSTGGLVETEKEWRRRVMLEDSSHNAFECNIFHAAFFMQHFNIVHNADI